MASAAARLLPGAAWVYRSAVVLIEAWPSWRLTVRGGAVRNASGNLAGSVCLIDEAISRLASIGLASEELRLAAEEVPRRILGLA